jgi:hypothetical protein
VELGVEIVSRCIDRHRVLGMGAQQDSLRVCAGDRGRCRSTPGLRMLVDRW